MRIERLEPSRRRRGRVLVFLEDGACLKITEQELLDFGLQAGEELDGEVLARLKAAAGISSVKGTAAELIGRRAMSRQELEKKLRERGASQAEARYAAEWMEAIGALNDREYGALLVRHYGQLGYGPAWIREKLREKGVPRELWEEALEELPEPGGQIDAFLSGKLRGREADEKARRRLTAALLRRGFSPSDVRDAWNRLNEEEPDQNW